MLFVVACLILTGCMESKDAVMQLDDAFAKDMEEMVIRTNNYGRYADYYLPSDTQEQSADILSYSFSYGRSNIIMDINVSGIINSKYYKDYLIADEGFFDQNKLYYSHEGQYQGNQRYHAARPADYAADAVTDGYQYADEIQVKRLIEVLVRNLITPVPQDERDEPADPRNVTDDRYKSGMLGHVHTSPLRQNPEGWLCGFLPGLLCLGLLRRLLLYLLRFLFFDQFLGHYQTSSASRLPLATCHFLYLLRSMCIA